MELKKYFERSLNNIIEYGDTDIFPFPLENFFFRDFKKEIVEELQVIHTNFSDFFTKQPPINENTLSSAGYTGFRWATQIDPLWNAYLLGLVISIGDKIEKARIPKEKETIFSYRFNYDKNNYNIFDKDIGWNEFQNKSLEHSHNYNFVLICDISDFYSRIYHHRIENALQRLKIGDVSKKIMEILQHFTVNKSYGLPIGGPAARLLSELLLNEMDKLLKSKNVVFCRFADDYHIFCQSREEAYRNLSYLSDKLMRNEGLSLQKSKTRIITTKEFIAASEYFVGDEDNEDKLKLESKRFLSISLRYDPYSPTADTDYEYVKEEIHKYDIVGMLSRELSKSRIHTSLTRKLIKAVKFADDSIKNNVAIMLIDNLEVLYPVIPNVMMLLREIFDYLNDEIQDEVCNVLCENVSNQTYLVSIDLNLCYVLRVLAKKYCGEHEALFVHVYESSQSKMIRRYIILAMANWEATYWISDIKNYYHSLGPWERRSFIMASYTLGDEGKHWREHIKKELTSFDRLFKEWAGSKVTNTGPVIPV